MTGGSPFPLRRLGDLVDVFDGPHATPRKVNSGPWFLNIASLKNGRVDLSESTHIHEDDVARWSRRVTPQRGDTLFSYETRIGEAAFWDSDDEAVLGRRMGLLRPRGGAVHPRFLSYAYLSHQFQEVIRLGTLYGATVNRIPIGAMPDWAIAVPPLEEQERIAGVLGAFDDFIETNRRLIACLEEVVSSSYDQHAASASRGTVPLSEVAVHLPGKYLAKDAYADGGQYAVYGSNSVMGTHDRFLYEGPMTVLARIGSNCGALRLSALPAWVNNNASVIKASEPAAQYRLHEALRRIDMDRHRTGSGQPFIRIESLMSDWIPWAGAIDSWDRGAETLIRGADDLRGEIEDLTRQRDELLPLLMSGKVRVRDVEAAVS